MTEKSNSKVDSLKKINRVDAPLCRLNWKKVLTSKNEKIQILNERNKKLQNESKERS